MARPFDESLDIVDTPGGDRLECRTCGERVCDADEAYKHHLLQSVKPLTEANQLLVDPDHYIDEEMEYREYYCPGCGRMIENEIVLAEQDPVPDKEVSAGSR